MTFFEDLTRQHADSRNGFFRGVARVTLHPQHDNVFAYWSSPKDEDAIRDDWEAIRSDFCKAILAVTPEQSHARSSREARTA